MLGIQIMAVLQCDATFFVIKNKLFQISQANIQNNNFVLYFVNN